MANKSHSTSANGRDYGAVVVGGGPAGITVVGNLLELRPRDSILWVDPLFHAGRVHAKYREVPSNTKVALFVAFAEAVQPFRNILHQTPEPHAVSVLRGLAQDKGCGLGKAADMCLMLTDGLAKEDGVQQELGSVTAATFDKTAGRWAVELDHGDPVTTGKLVLCTGSSPVDAPLPVMDKMRARNLRSLHLDTALAPSVLSTTFDPASAATVAVVGASHSAILVLLNLSKLASTTHPKLRVKWFTRNKLRYAVPMDGWILRDNTGLKGEAADWARANLEEGKFESSPASKFIKKVWTTREHEDAVYERELPGCTHIVQAIGYKRDPIPELSIVEAKGAPAEPLSVIYEPLSGKFVKSLPIGSAATSEASDASAASSSGNGEDEKEFVPGLFGAGIAYPERVTDPHGNVEYAVGFWKFMKYAKRVVPQWVS